MYANTKKSFNGFYFTIAESIILNIVNNLVIGSIDIVHRKGGIAIDHDLLKFNRGFKELSGRALPAFFFVLRNSYMIIIVWAGERKAFGKLISKYIPIILFKGSEKIFDT